MPAIGSNLHAQMDKVISAKSIEMSSILFSKIDNEDEFTKWLNEDVFKMAEGVKVEVPREYKIALQRKRDIAARAVQNTPGGIIVAFKNIRIPNLLPHY